MREPAGAHLPNDGREMAHAVDQQAPRDVAPRLLPPIAADVLMTAAAAAGGILSGGAFIRAVAVTAVWLWAGQVQGDAVAVDRDVLGGCGFEDAAAGVLKPLHCLHIPRTCVVPSLDCFALMLAGAESGLFSATMTSVLQDWMRPR